MIYSTEVELPPVTVAFRFRQVSQQRVSGLYPIVDRMCSVLLLHNLAMVLVQYLHRGVTGAGSPFELSGPRNRESFWSERPHD